MKENTFINQVINYLDERLNRIGFVQFRNCNAYYGYEPITMYWADEIVGYEREAHVIPIRSYNTIVGFADIDNQVVYEYGKYSRTTSKQFSQICHTRFPNYERVLVDVETYNRW